jgi:AcrR family transcriptional regulator
MAIGAQSEHSATADAILAAARQCLVNEGYAALSTRKVAVAAGAPLSQVHYHFGSRSGLVVAVMHEENRRRLARQVEMYAADAPLWKRYEQACDFLDDDLESGFVRLLQELLAAGWSVDEIAEPARQTIDGWFQLLIDVAREAAERFDGLGPFAPDEIATLIGCAFLGAEELLLLGFDRHRLPIRASLRRIGQLIRQAEEAAR